MSAPPLVPWEPGSLRLRDLEEPAPISRNLPPFQPVSLQGWDPGFRHAGLILINAYQWASDFLGPVTTGWTWQRWPCEQCSGFELWCHTDAGSSCGSVTSCQRTVSWISYLRVVRRIRWLLLPESLCFWDFVPPKSSNRGWEVSVWLLWGQRGSPLGISSKIQGCSFRFCRPLTWMHINSGAVSVCVCSHMWGVCVLSAQQGGEGICMNVVEIMALLRKRKRDEMCREKKKRDVQSQVETRGDCRGLERRGDDAPRGLLSAPTPPSSPLSQPFSKLKSVLLPLGPCEIPLLGYTFLFCSSSFEWVITSITLQPRELWRR